MNNSQKTMKDYLEMDGNIAFNMAIYNLFSSYEDRSYSEICGGFREGVYEWANHNIEDVIECENSKYIGWTIILGSGYGTKERRMYIEKWVMNIKPTSWKHAKALFNKYVREDGKFNQAQRMKEQQEYYIGA